MIYFALTIAVQILCVMHVVRTGRPQWWIFIIILAPLIGMVAYFLLEILPEIRGDRRMRYARRVAAAKVDPDRDLRVARDALETADTVANRVMLGDALVAREDYESAVAEYRIALKRPGGHDEKTRFKLAQALLGAGHGDDALREITELPASDLSAETARRKLLLAQCLEFVGRTDEAEALYWDVAERYANIEARCRYAALLITQGEDLRARAELLEVERATRGWDIVQMGDDKPMLDWARAKLKRIG